MTIFWTVCKIIGIILGVLLFLLLLLLLAFLFVPVRYTVTAYVPDTDPDREEELALLKERARLRVRGSYLLHLFRFSYSLPDAPEWVVRPKWLSSFFGGSAGEPAESAQAPEEPDTVFSKILYTISSVCDRIEEVRAMLESETFARAKDCVLKQTKRLVRGVLPKRSDIRVLYGTGDAVLTAEIFAALSVLTPFTYPCLTVRPDYTGKVIGCDAHLAGRVTLFRILSAVLIVYFNKDVRRIKRRIDRIRRETDGTESV